MVPTPESARPDESPRLPSLIHSEIDVFETAHTTLAIRSAPSQGTIADILPVRQFEPQIRELLESNDIVILTSETGSGKTTQIPQILGELGLSVLVTQPRRVTTTSAAERVAEEMGELVGGTVGFAHGLEKNYSAADTRILFCTDGYELVRELSAGRDKRQFDVLVLDEIHEMNSNMVLLLALAREYVQEHPGTKLMVMSATMNAGTIAAYMGYDGAPAPVLEIPGRTFPVTVAEPIASEKLDLYARIEAEITDRVSRQEELLVFLPGKREIERMSANLRKMGLEAAVIPFHSELSREALDEAFINRGQPRVILATNIAQTGLTLSVDTVIDSGLERSISQIYNDNALDVSEVSQFDVAQRMGRVGRDKPGAYVYLGTTPIDQLPAEPTPDLLRSSIDSLVLRLLHAGRPIETMNLLHQPSEEQVRVSYQRLAELGIIHDHRGEHSITKLGKQVVKLPVDVRAGIMISEALRREEEFPGITREVIDIVAVLETGSMTDPRMEREWKKLFRGEDRSDLLGQLAIFHEAEGRAHYWYINHGVKERQIERAVSVRQLLLDRIELPEETSGPRDGAPMSWEPSYRRQVLECVWSGMIDSAFRRVRDGWTNGSGVRQLPRDSVLKEAKLVVGAPFGIGNGSTPDESEMQHFVFSATEIDPSWYKNHFGHLPERKQRLAQGLSSQAHEDRKHRHHDGHRSSKLGKQGRRRDHHDGRSRH
mgnify:CR=1 FL=1